MIKIKWFNDQWIHIKFSRVLLYMIMLVLVAFTALPLIYVVSTAFKPMDELFLFPPRFFVKNPTTQSFMDLLQALGSSSVPFLRYLFNSLSTTVVTVFFTVFVSSMGAYSLVKLKPPGGNFLFSVILMALTFSPHVTTIPSYMVINRLGLINSYWALILPNIAVAYNIFLMKQFLEQYPDVLLEAARIDGAREMHIFAKLVMPAAKPAWSTLVVFSFVKSWNDAFSPLVYITSQEMKTLPLAMSTISGGGVGVSTGRAGAVAAATFVMTVPTVIVFTVMQSNVMETMQHSGIKG